MKKAKLYNCPFCGEQVFDKYCEGKKEVYHKNLMGMYIEKHTCNLSV